MFYTCYFANRKMLEIEDCVYISISCGNPKYSVPYQIVDCKLLKPYGIFGKDLSDEEYIRRYREKLERIGVDRIRAELASLVHGHKNAVLLCHEKNPNDCHRRDFANWLFEKTNVMIAEYGENCTKTKENEAKNVENDEKSAESDEKPLEQMSIYDIIEDKKPPLV